MDKGVSDGFCEFHIQAYQLYIILAVEKPLYVFSIIFEGLDWVKGNVPWSIDSGMLSSRKEWSLSARVRDYEYASWSSNVPRELIIGFVSMFHIQPY